MASRFYLALLESAGCSLWQIKYIKDGFARHSREIVHSQSQYAGTGDKDDPSFEKMKDIIGSLSTPVIDRYTDQTNPDAVHNNRERDTGQKHQGALPERRIEQIGGKKAQA